MAIKKKEFDLKDLKDKYSTNTKYKETEFYSCGEVFLNATGLPGPVKGGINLFLGHTNTSKTSAMILAAVDAQKKGDLPVLIITEKKWSWEHAQLLGLDCKQESDGQWTGNFIYNDSFDWLEQLTDFINELLDQQEKGNIPFSLAFFIDSIGSIPCKLQYDGKSGKMHTAGVLADKVGMGLHSRIAKSKKEGYPYYNTLVCVTQAWTQLPDSPFGQPEIKARGGEALWLASSLVYLFGKQARSGINHIDAIKNGRKVSYAIRTRISILKNHVNGISLKDGKLIAVPQGFIADTKEAMDEYKKKYSNYWNQIFGDSSGDFEIEESEEENSYGE